jgi:predicted transcriptional regulator
MPTMQLLQPQEVEVFYILPAIRKAFSTALKAQGKSQKEIARLLGVTEAAVSQYLHDKRAHVQFPKELRDAVEEAAKKITSTQSMIEQTQLLLAKAWKDRLVCKLHAQLSAVPKRCEVCFK